MDIVLIPGLWLDASSWDAVAPALEAAGHRAHALTLPGMDSPDADRSSITLADHVAAVVAAIDAVDPVAGPVVVVGARVVVVGANVVALSDVPEVPTGRVNGCALLTSMSTRFEIGLDAGTMAVTRSVAGASMPPSTLPTAPESRHACRSRWRPACASSRRSKAA